PRLRVLVHHDLVLRPLRVVVDRCTAPVLRRLHDPRVRPYGSPQHHEGELTMTEFDAIGEAEAAQALVDHWNRNHPDNPVGIDDVADAARAVVAAVTAPVAIIGVREAADVL